MSFWEKLKIKVDSMYKNIDHTILPLEIERLLKEKDYIKLFKLSPFLEFYEEFHKTHETVENRNTPIHDFNDVIAFMIRNSSLKLERNPQLRLALDIFDYEILQHLDACELLIMRHEFRVEMLFEEYEKFVTYKAKIPDIPRIIINRKLEKDVVYCRKIFDKLEHHEKLEIIEGGWKEANVEGRGVNYLLFLKLHFEVILPKEVYKRHPQLLLMSGDTVEIVKTILDFSCSNDSLMRLYAKNFSEVGGISETNLVTKCLMAMKK
jgi:hypothetical protein